jgi:hypothetical protein
MRAAETHFWLRRQKSAFAICRDVQVEHTDLIGSARLGDRVSAQLDPTPTFKPINRDGAAPFRLLHAP